MRARVLLLALLAVAPVVTAGCASAPSYRTHPELPQRKPGIAAVGVLPPVIRMFEEQARFSLNEAVPHDEWSKAADEAVAKAFAAEMASDRVPLVPIATDGLEENDLAELYSAVEFSILRHGFEKQTGEMLPREPFPEQVRSLDYSLGPAAELMDRHHVDAVWIVSGFNLLPTAGAKAKRGLDTFLTILSALGGVGVPNIQLQKIQLRVALVGRNGGILYFGVADYRTPAPGAQPPLEAAPTDGNPAPGAVGEATYAAIDLRDPRAARHYLRAALAGYREKAAP